MIDWKNEEENLRRYVGANLQKNLFTGATANLFVPLLPVVGKSNNESPKLGKALGTKPTS